MIFEKNISVLRQRDRKLAESLSDWSSTSHVDVVHTKIGMPSARVSNIILHSLYDPLKEARAWVRYHGERIDQSGSIYVLGFGFGYHVMELCSQTDRPVIVCEPDLGVLKKAIENVDLTPILSSISIMTDSTIPAENHSFTVLPHKPSVALNPQFFDSVHAQLRSAGAIRKGMRILVVSPIYGGSLPVARYCSSSLIKMGHTVELIDNSRFDGALFYAKDVSVNRQNYNLMVQHLSSFISEAVAARCESFRPDLVLALAQAPLSADCLKYLRGKNVTTAYWFVEDFRFMEYWKNIAGHYDFFFTIQQGEFFDELRKAGIRNYHYLPVAACPDIHKPVPLPEEEVRYYGSDLSFVGAGYYNRRHFLKGLLDFDFKIWGSDWDLHSDLGRCIQRGGARIDTDEIVKIFNASKININLHSSTYHKGINPFGDFINPRTFEIMACGGFQLADMRPALEGLFEEGEEIIVFNDLEDLRGKAVYYLANPEERCAVAERGRQRVLREHTYEKRMERMLTVMADRGLHEPLWPEDGERVECLVEEAGRESDLGQYLSRFTGKGRITLSDITEEIAGSEGALSGPERMFMVMNEFVR